MTKISKILMLSLLCLLFVGFGCSGGKDDDTSETTEVKDTETIKIEDSEEEPSETLMLNKDKITDDEVEDLTNEVILEEETTQISAVGGYSGTATATRSFDGSIFKHTVTAEIADPAPGKFYEGWLVKKSPSLQFFSTGKMIQKDGKYYLEYEASEDKHEFNEVVITEETESNGLDGNPEAHVLEGNF